MKHPKNECKYSRVLIIYFLTITSQYTFVKHFNGEGVEFIWP